MVHHLLILEQVWDWRVVVFVTGGKHMDVLAYLLCIHNYSAVIKELAMMNDPVYFRR